VLRNSSVLAWALLLGCQAVPAATAESPATAVATPPTASAAPRALTAPPPEPAPAATATATEPPAPPSPFVLRYVCDDKYDEGSVCRPGNPAWDTWLGSIQLTTVAPNLFKHEGGGPSGAEWNPNAPLVAFVASAKAGSARLKSSKATFTPVARLGDYDVFLVPLKAWNAATRGAEAEDFPPDTELGPVTVVELRAIGPQGELARGTFACSYGE
jgi:hypothetical protein